MRDATRSVLQEVNNIFISPRFVKGRKSRNTVVRQIPRQKKQTIRPKPQRKVAPVKVTKTERKVLKIIEAPQPAEEFEDKDTDDWNRVLSGADDRLEQINKEVAEPTKPKRERLFPGETLSTARRHLLFMNVGTDKILQAKYALQVGSPLPLWTTSLSDKLAIEKGKLTFEGLPVVTQEDKRNLVKEMYFDAKLPSTIQPITDALRDKYANISRTNVRNILRSLETYQRNFARRLPAKVSGRMSVNKPGIIACDAFFPSAKFGWIRTGMCLTMMDVYSRFCHIYKLEDKKKETVRKAMVDFFQRFSSLGWLPLQGLSDKGTDLSPFGEVFETYRGNRKGKLVFKSVTGGPVNVVEHLNAQVQRRMEIFRTARITDDPATILDDISFQINHQKRPDKENLTPMEILRLSQEQINQLNKNAPDRTRLSGPLSGLKEIRVGNTVRLLQMTRKDQVKGALKGFQPKWSKRTYTVLKITALRKNPGMFRYFLNDSPQSYYRHELLLIPKKVDRRVPRIPVKKPNLVVVGEDWSDLEYDSDDSRA